MSQTLSLPPLTRAERSAYEAFNCRIERGLQTWIEVGICLTEIRDKRLYRDEYDTFEAYCEGKWQFARRRADHLIQRSCEWLALAAEIRSFENSSSQNEPKVPNTNDVPALDPLVPKHDAAIAELIKVPKRQRAEVYTEALRMANHHAPERAHIAAARKRLDPQPEPVSEAPPVLPPKEKPPKAEATSFYYAPDYGGSYQIYFTMPDGTKGYLAFKEEKIVRSKSRGLARKEQEG